jgi:hypothetical protein
MNKYGGDGSRIVDIEKSISGTRDKNYRKGVHKAMLIYRDAVENSGLDRCVISYRDFKRNRIHETSSRIMESMDDICLLSHLLFFQHKRIIDRVLLKNLSIGISIS